LVQLEKHVTGGLMSNSLVAPMIYHPVERHMLGTPNKMAAKPETKMLLLPAPAQRKLKTLLFQQR
jgi:hypothetical protein